MKLLYPACFYPASEDETGYTVVIPDLPGCVTEGDSLADALEHAVEAASGWILGELEDGNPIPDASDYQDIVSDSGGFVNLIVLDMDTYIEKHSKKTVRKNVTIPAWLNTYGEENHINFSNVLQKALLKLVDSRQ